MPRSGILRRCARARCVLGPLALLALAAGCTRSEPAVRRPNLVLITVDTLRADHLSAWGYRLPTSPSLDRLAASGVRFADATVPWPKTWPAVASLLTGKYPATTGVRLHPRLPLPSEHETLAEVLRSAGYSTAAVVANVNVGARFAFDQGFEVFVEAWSEGLRRETGEAAFSGEPSDVKRFASGRVVTDEALGLLSDLASGPPFFLWLHYIDPHGPYLPPPEYDGLWKDAYPSQPVSVEDIPRYQRQLDEDGVPITDLSHYIARYDREIRFFDDQLERLLDALAARGLRDDTVVALTSDHGESLHEDGYLLEHGAAPYQPTAAVPLVLVFPPAIPAGKVVSSPVGVIDLLPTLFEILDVAPPVGLQGRSLVATWQSPEQPPASYVFLESGSYEPSQLSVRKGRWKLAHLRAPRDRRVFGRREFELYDLESDPDEEIDRSAEHPELVRELSAELQRWRETTPSWTGSTEAAAIDPETRAMLRALGYVHD